MKTAAIGVLVGILVLAGQAQPLGAKPLLDSSEESYGSVCLDYDDTPQRLVEICTFALDQPGATPQQRAEMLESLGYAYYNLNKLDAAQAAFEKMHALRPNDPKALVGQGWVAHERRDFATARDSFSKALDHSANAQAMAGMADSLWELGEVSVDEALRFFDGALAIDPDYGWAKRQKGWVLIDARRFEQAETLFRGIVDVSPNDTNARAGLVRVLVRTGSYEKALDQANRVLQDSPDAYWFLSQRANILFYLDRYRQAIRDADRLIELDPKDPEGYVRRARAMVYLGQSGDALALLAKTEKDIGKHEFLTYWRARLLFDDDQLDQALLRIKANTDTDLVDIFDLKLLARIEIARQDYTAAQNAIDRAKTLRADDAYTIYYDAILMLRRAQSVEHAIERFDQAIAAGLPKDEIGEFAGELYQAGFLLQAIAIRAKYPD